MLCGTQKGRGGVGDMEEYGAYGGVDKKGMGNKKELRKVLEESH